VPSSSDTLPSRLAFAYALAALAGAVDAIGVLSLGDVFVSFMSGNTTLLGAAVAHLDGRHAGQLALIVLVFLAGVVAGECLAVSVAPRSRPPAVLVAVAAGLAAAAVLAWLAVGHFAVALCLAASMGVKNATVRRAGGMDVALTYVTGTLVRAGRLVASALLSRGDWKDAAPIFGLWASFALGAAAGGLVAMASATVAIAAAAGCAAALAAFAMLRSPHASADLPGSAA